MKKKEVRAVIFDIGGVLTQPKSRLDIKTKQNQHYMGVHQKIAKKLNIPLDQWFDAIDSVYSDSYVGKFSEKKTVSIISRNVGVSSQKIKKIVIDSYKENFNQNKQLYNFAFQLKKRGYKIAIISDQWCLSKDAVVNSSYMKKFDYVAISCDLKIRKPQLKIYQLTLKKLSLKPEQTVFIDNQTWNLTPAKKLGMKTILFKNNKQTFKELKRLGIK